MNITNIDLKVSKEDFKGVLEDIIDIAKLEDLKLYTVDFVDGLLLIKGTYKYKIEIPFKAVLKFISVEDNIVKVKIEKFSVAKIAMARWVKKIALKKFFDSLMVIGLISYQDNIYVELETVFTIVPFVTMTIKSLYIEDDTLIVSMENLEFDMEKKFIPFEEAMKANEKIQSVRELNPKKKIEVPKVILNNKNKINDLYSDVREKITKKISPEYKELAQYTLAIPDLISLIFRLLKDTRVNKTNKILLGVVAAYVVSPVDIIPDRIPFVGKIDEVALVFFALDNLINSEDRNIILENWEGKDSLIDLIRNVLSLLKPLVGADSVERIYGYINRNLVKA